MVCDNYGYILVLNFVISGICNHVFMNYFWNLDCVMSRVQPEEVILRLFESVWCPPPQSNYLIKTLLVNKVLFHMWKSLQTVKF